MENTVGRPHAIRLFEEAESATIDSRQLSERDRDYKDNKQWTAEEEAVLRKRGQPVVTYNRIGRKVNFLTGLEKQQRKDPKGFPRTPKDEGSAQAATDSLRYVCDNSQWDKKRSAAAKNMIVEGTGATMVGAKRGKDGIDPELINIPWDRLFWDPHSSELDFSDANYMGIVTWMDEAKALEMYPGKEEFIRGTIDGCAASETYGDKPKWQIWGDFKRRRVRVIECYYLQDGQWMMCHATQAGELVESQPSPYHDEDGQPENPIKANTLYIDRENSRYGEVRVMISPQDEINKRRSKGLHLASMRQFRRSPGAAMDADDMKKELAKPDGHVEAEKDDFNILDTNDMEAANFQMMQEAKAEIDLLGPNAALQGKNENDMSGRAIMAQQQGGMVEAADILDAIREHSLAVYRSIWARIRQFWTEERWIRVTDDERNLRFVGLNQPLTVAQLAQKVSEGDEQAIEDAREFLGSVSPQLAAAFDASMQGDQQATMMIGMFVRDHGNVVVKVENSVSELDIDVVIDEGMDTPMVQAEQFDTLSKVVPSLVQLAQAGPMGLGMARALVMASSLRDKDKILDMLEDMDQGPQVPPEIQQKMAEMEQALQQLSSENEALKQDREGAEADRALKGAEIELKGREIEQKDAEIANDSYRAETERMVAENPPEPARQAA